MFFRSLEAPTVTARGAARTRVDVSMEITRSCPNSVAQPNNLAAYACRQKSLTFGEYERHRAPWKIEKSYRWYPSRRLVSLADYMQFLQPAANEATT